MFLSYKWRAGELTTTSAGRTAPSKYKFIRQSVTLDGAGTQAFEAAKSSREQIYELFDWCFEEKKLEALGQATTLELSNRYLTPKRDMPNTQHIGFDNQVDPKGVLEEMSQEGDGFVHTEDNAVAYWQRKTDAKGNRR